MSVGLYWVSLDIYNYHAPSKPLQPRLFKLKCSEGKIVSEVWLILILWWWRKNFIPQNISFSWSFTFLVWVIAFQMWRKFIMGGKCGKSSIVVHHLYGKGLLIPGMFLNLENSSRERWLCHGPILSVQHIISDPHTLPCIRHRCSLGTPSLSSMEQTPIHLHCLPLFFFNFIVIEVN